MAEQPLHRALGLTDGELDRIRSLLGRDPNDFELGVFSLLWSEHCGYKHSALLLRRFPTEGPAVLQGPGENAGVVDLGEGLACAFKVESHNHPSAVEPFQGAATGVGGILRDIIAMGARPIALLDGLRFGAEDFSFDRAVAGIGHYGNCVGVPTVGGEAVFDPAYRDNPLVNAMCVGILPAERVTRARASGAGNLVVLYGATTGRDGIGGASVLASQELSDEDEDKRPTVQIGDPVHGQEADRGEPRADRRRARRVAAGPRRRRSRLLARRDGRPRRRRPRRPPRPGAAPRARPRPGGDHGLREPGADGGRRRARRGSPQSRPSAASGSCTPP